MPENNNKRRVLTSKIENKPTGVVDVTLKDAYD